MTQESVPKHENNPWDISSIYAFQYFNCPSCLYKSVSKQDFVCHAFNTHPESTEYFKNISDKSLSDVLLPWMEDEENFPLQQKVKIELKEDNNINNEEILDFDSGFHQNHPPNDRPEGKAFTSLIQYHL